MIEISNVSKTYETGNKALRNVSITIEDGEFVFIIGRSGSGKTTLFKLLLKETEPTSGKIVVNDMNLGKMPRRYVPKYRRRLGVVFQDFRLLKDRNVYENVAFAQRVIGASTRRIRESVPAAKLPPPGCATWGSPCWSTSARWPGKNSWPAATLRRLPAFRIWRKWPNPLFPWATRPAKGGF